MSTPPPHGHRRSAWIGRAIVLGAIALAAFVAWADGASPPPNPRPTSFESAGGMRIHIVQTGWVSVKRNFRDLNVWAALRVPSIILDWRWTEWLPIQLYVLEHAEGIVVFDTGETARIHEEGYFACDPGTEWFYLNQLRFSVAPEDELGPQLRRLDLDPRDVRWAVLSHLHSDHMGGMAHLEGSEFLISAIDWPGQLGALVCRIPEFVEPRLVTWKDGPFGAFERSEGLTSAGDLRMVPTPGHSPGHQSLLLREGDSWTLFAGDAVFDQVRLEDGRGLAGIVEDVAAARESVAVLQKQMREFRTRLAPAHDARVRHSHAHPSD